MTDRKPHLTDWYEEPERRALGWLFTLAMVVAVVLAIAAIAAIVVVVL